MKPCILFILDGLGDTPESITSYFHELAQTFPMGLLTTPKTAGEGHEIMGNSISALLASMGKHQEKWFDPVNLPVATYFFNAQHYEPYQHETWKSFTTSQKLLQAPAGALPKSEASFILISCCAPGEIVREHQGSDVTVMMEKLNRLVRTAIDIMLFCGSTVLLTSSYGSAGTVPLFLISKEFEGKHFKGSTDAPPITHDWQLTPVIGTLSDIAPTLLKLMGLEKPREMKGTPLI